MLNNSIKSNWTLEELRWDICVRRSAKHLPCRRPGRMGRAHKEIHRIGRSSAGHSVRPLYPKVVQRQQGRSTES